MGAPRHRFGIQMKNQKERESRESNANAKSHGQFEKDCIKSILNSYNAVIMYYVYSYVEIKF